MAGTGHTIAPCIFTALFALHLQFIGLSSPLSPVIQIPIIFKAVQMAALAWKSLDPPRQN